MKKIIKIVLIIAAFVLALILIFTKMVEGIFNLIIDSL